MSTAERNRTIVATTAELDAGPGPRGRIGLIALANGHTSELEMREILPYPEVVLYVNRIDSRNEVNIAALREQEADLMRAASLILPAGRLDVIAYGCTSGTIAMGEATIADRIRNVRPDIAVTTPFTAALAGLAALQARRIALLTPYSFPVTKSMCDFIERGGIEIVCAATFNMDLDSEMNRVSPASIRRAIHKLDRPDCEAIFVCCTALRANSVIEELEHELGKPVISSNQALAWHALRLVGYREHVENFGQLLRL